MLYLFYFYRSVILVVRHIFFNKFRELVVGISEIKLDNFYHSGFLNSCLRLYCYIHNIPADMSSGFVQVFVKLRNLHRTSNHVLYLIHGGHLFWSRYNNRVQVLSILVLLLTCMLPSWTNTWKRPEDISAETLWI